MKVRLLDVENGRQLGELMESYLNLAPEDNVSFVDEDIQKQYAVQFSQWEITGTKGRLEAEKLIYLKEVKDNDGA